MGLTDHDAAAWQSAADLYAWGSFEEMPAPAGSFDDQPVAISVTVWDGVNEPGELKWSGPMRDLTTGITDLARHIAEAVHRRASTTPSKATDAHRTLATTLDARAADITKRLAAEKDPSFWTSPTGRRRLAYHQQLLELACFFDPTGRERRLKLLETTWTGRIPKRDGFSAETWWKRFQDFRRFSEAFPLTADGKPDHLMRQRRMEMLQQAIDGWRDFLPADQSYGHLMRAARIWTDEVKSFHQWAHAPEGTEPPWLADYRRKWFEFLVVHQSFTDGNWGGLGAETVRDVINNTWPELKPAFLTWRDTVAADYNGDPQPAVLGYLLDTFRTVGDAATILPRLTAPGTSPATGSAAAKPAHPNAPVKVANPTLMREWGSPVPLTTSQQYAQGFHGPELPFKYDYGSQLSTSLREIDWETKSFYRIDHRHVPVRIRSGHWIDAIAFDGRNLWIGSTKAGPPSQIIVLNPWSESAIMLDDVLGPHSAVQGFHFQDDRVWIAFTADGLWQLGPQAHAIRRFVGADGLASPRLAHVYGQKNQIVINTDPASGIWQVFDTAKNQFFDLPKGEVAPPKPVGWVLPYQNMTSAVCGDWLVKSGAPYPQLFRRSTNQWQPWFEPRRAQELEKQRLNPNSSWSTWTPPDWSTSPYSVATSDGKRLWLGGGAGILTCDPTDPVGTARFIQSMPVMALAHQGKRLWVSTSQTGQPFQRSDNRPEPSRIAVFDKESLQWLGWFDVPDGPIVHLAASSEELFLSTPGRVFVLDTRSLFQPDRLSEKPKMDFLAAWLDRRTPLDEFLAATLREDVATMARLARPEKAGLERALMAASTRNSAGAAAWLLQQGVDANIVGDNAEFPLRLAARTGNLEVAKRLVAGGARIDFQGPPSPLLLSGGTWRSAPTPAAPSEKKSGTFVKPRLRLVVPVGIELSWDAPAGNEQTVIYRKTSVDHGFRNITNLTEPHGSANGYLDRSARREGETYEYYVQLGDPLDGIGQNVAALQIRVGAGMAPVFSENEAREILSGGRAIPSLPTEETALMVAAEAGHTDFCAWLLDNGASPDLCDMASDTALHRATRNGWGECARLFVRRGADVNVANLIDETPVQLAYRRHTDRELFELLLARGADPNRGNWRPLVHDIIVSGEERDIELVLSHGGQLDIRDANKRSAAWHTYYAGNTDRFHALLKRAPENTFLDALLLALVVERGDLETFELFAAQGFDPNMIVDRLSLLALALRSNQIEMARRLIECGAKDIAAKGAEPASSFAKSPEMKALFTPSGNTLALRWPQTFRRFHVGPPASPIVPPAESVRNAVADRALESAINTGEDTAVRAALEAGAWIDITFADGGTPLTRAVQNHRRTTVQLLLERGASSNHFTRQWFTPLVIAADANDLEMCRLLLTYGALPSFRGNSDFSPMHFAARQSFELTRLLLEYGGNPNEMVTLGFDGDPEGVCPLFAAAEAGRADIIEILLDQGASINARSLRPSVTSKTSPFQINKTPAMVAAEANHKSALEVLIARGADLQAVSRKGYNALDFAILSKATECIPLLKARGLQSTVRPTDQAR